MLGIIGSIWEKSLFGRGRVNFQDVHLEKKGGIFAYSCGRIGGFFAGRPINIHKFRKVGYT